MSFSSSVTTDKPLGQVWTSVSQTFSGGNLAPALGTKGLQSFLQK